MTQRLSAKDSRDDSYGSSDEHYLGRFSGNPYTTKNVNVAQGPRNGNADAHEGKRGAFIDAKQERAPLADFIERAYATRNAEDYEQETTRAGEVDRAVEQVRAFPDRRGTPLKRRK